eukprot:281289_1
MSTNYSAINENTLTTDVHHIVYESDLRKVTQRAVFQRLEDKYGISLEKFKPHVYDRAVEEARLRIQSCPELQKQQISNTKYYSHQNHGGGIVEQQKFYNTIYNTNSYNNNNANINNTNNVIKSASTAINYQDVKNHYIGGKRMNNK